MPAAPAARRLLDMTRPAPTTIVALVLAVVPSLVFVAGIPLHDGAPGTCDAWPSCSASARDQWGWTARPWATLGIGAAAFVVTVGRVAAWLQDRPAMVRRAAVVALTVSALVTGAFVLLAAVVWGTDCSDAGWICFGGPDDALELGSPALPAGATTALLVAGLKRRNTDGSRLSSWTLAGIVAVVVAVVAGGMGGAALAVLATAWGAS